MILHHQTQRKISITDTMCRIHTGIMYTDTVTLIKSDEHLSSSGVYSIRLESAIILILITPYKGIGTISENADRLANFSIYLFHL